MTLRVVFLMSLLGCGGTAEIPREPAAEAPEPCCCTYPEGKRVVNRQHAPDECASLKGTCGDDALKCQVDLHRREKQSKLCCCEDDGTLRRSMNQCNEPCHPAFKAEATAGQGDSCTW